MIDRQVIIPACVVTRAVGRETVLLNAETGRYFTLDEVGARVWTLLADTGRLETVLESLRAEFEVDDEELRRDLDALIAQLETCGLLEIQRA